MTVDERTSLAALPAEREQPLAAPAVIALTLSATGVALLFYLYCVLALLVVGTLFLVEGVLLLALARIGLAQIMLGPLGALGRLMISICRSLGLKPSVEYRLPLLPDDAPRLFERIAQIAARVGVPPPRQTMLEVGVNARVRLPGYRKGGEGTILILGYDLLVILTQGELDAVLAHEMAHARLVERGWQGWLGNGLARIGQLDDALGSAIVRAAAEERKFHTARLLSLGVHRLGGSLAKLITRLWRQDEFTADALAAEVCGASACRSALLRTRIASEYGAPLTWRDRMIRFQRGDGYAAWLRDRLTPSDEEREELERLAFAERRESDFDTHPPLADRLAMLPEAKGPAPSGPPAISLLPDPEDVVARLFNEIERLAAKEERAESERLRQEVRKKAQGEHHTPIQGLGIILVVVGLLLAVRAALSLDEGAYFRPIALGWLAGSLGFAALGVRFYRGGRFRERIAMPVPRIGCWKAAMEPAVRGGITEAELEALQTELTAAGPVKAGKKTRASHYGSVAYRALASCDYPRALIASQLALKADRSCLEGLLAHGVALAYLGEAQGADQLLGRAYTLYGVGTSVSWAIGWACLLQGDWENAEPYLLEAAMRRATVSTLWSLASYAQSQQQKLREAERSLRQALALEPEEREYRLQLARLLLAMGRPKDLLVEVERLEREAPGEMEVALCRIGGELHLGRDAAAARCAEALLASAPGPTTVLRLGQYYLDADRFDAGTEYLERALAEAFYPEAHLCLARVAHERKEKEGARRHLNAALDLTRTVGPDGASPLDLLETICHGLLALEEPAEGGTTWVAVVDLPIPDGDAQKLGLLVHAGTQNQAREHVRALCRALRPDQAPVDAAVTWEAADPMEGRRPPGIYGARIE